MEVQKMANQTVLITGANRGLGNSCIKALLASPSFSNGKILMGSRNLESGKDACEKLGDKRVEVVELDVTSKHSIASAAKTVRTMAPNGISALINNAGVLGEAEGGEGGGEHTRELRPY